MENLKASTPKKSKIPIPKKLGSSNDSVKSGNSSSSKNNKLESNRKILQNSISSEKQSSLVGTKIETKTDYKTYFANSVLEEKNEKGTYSNPMTIDTSEPQENSSSKDIQENKTQEKIFLYPNDGASFNNDETENFIGNEMDAEQIKQALANVTYEDIDDFSPKINSSKEDNLADEDWTTLAPTSKVSIESLNENSEISPKINSPKEANLDDEEWTTLVLSSSESNESVNENSEVNPKQDQLLNPQLKSVEQNGIPLFTLSETLDGPWKQLREMFSYRIVEKFKELLAKEQMKICLDSENRPLDQDIDVDKEKAEEMKLIENLLLELEDLQMKLDSLKKHSPSNYEDTESGFIVEIIF